MCNDKKSLYVIKFFLGCSVRVLPEIYLLQMAKNALNYQPWLEKNLKFTYFKWLKMF